MNAEMQQGKNKVLLFRKLADQTTTAAKLVFQTEHTFSYSRSLDKIVTKDGAVIKVGELESEVSIDAIQAKNDPVGKMLRDAVIKGEKLELWEVTVDEDLKEEVLDDVTQEVIATKYPAVYAQGYLDSWENGAGAEDESTISSNFMVELEPQFGMATLTEEQQLAVQYAFKDTTAETGA